MKASLKQKFNFKQEKGAVTLFVLLAVLFFVMVLFAIFYNVSNMNRAQNEEIRRIQENYKIQDTEFNQIYNTLKNKIYNTYTVSYSGNGATSGSMKNSSFNIDVDKNLSSNQFEKKFTVSYSVNDNIIKTDAINSAFKNWNTKADGTGTSYSNNQTVRNLANKGETVVLYAQWENNTVILPNTEVAGYAIEGWYADTAYTNRVGSVGDIYTPTSDSTLYAKLVVPIFQVASQKYATLQQAVEACTTGSTITVLNNSEDASSPVINKNITIDTNGFAITKKVDDIEIAAGATVTIQGAGSIKSSNEQLATIQNKGTLNVGAVTISASKCNAIENFGSVYVSNGAELKSERADKEGVYNYPTIVNMENSYLEVNGGSITSNVVYTLSNNKPNSRIKINSGTIRATAGVTISNSDATSNLEITGGTITADAGGTIGNNGTITISGGTITSLTSTAITSNKKITVSGGEISGTTNGIINGAGTCTISGTAKIIGSTSGGYPAVVNKENMTISGGTITGGSSYAVWNNLAGSTLTISGGNINATTTATSVNNIAGATVNMTGGNISTALASVGIYNAGEATISGGTIGTGGNAINNLGTCTISGTVKLSGSTENTNPAVVNQKLMTVTGGSIIGGKTYALYNYNTAQDLEIRDGTISGGTSYGIYAVKGNVLVKGGVINAPNSYGIYATSGCTNVTIGDASKSISTTTPSVTGKTYGVYIASASTTSFNFNNGVIKGATSPGYNGTPILRTGCTVKTTVSGSVYSSVIQDKYNATLSYTGNEQIVTIPTTGTYDIEVAGASGSGGNSYGNTYTGTGGKGAKLIGTFDLNAGDKLHFVVGGQGSITNATSNDGTSGGGGGGTFVFREISAITDSKYQFTKASTKYETLLVAAGGGGSQDCAYKSVNSTGYDGEGANYYSPSNYTAYSTTTNAGTASTSLSAVLGISQYISYDSIGAFYTRNSGKAQGGYGGGGAADDNYSYGGGWAQGSTTYQTKSWSLDTTATGVDGANTGNGYAKIQQQGNPAPQITFDSEGETYKWGKGNGYYTSGNTSISDSKSTLRSNSFTINEEYDFKFDWAISCAYSYDYMYYTIYKDGVAMSDTGETTKISGYADVTNESELTYTNITKRLEAGTYYIEFTYKKGFSGKQGLDAGFVKNIYLQRTSAVVNLERASIRFDSYGETYPWVINNGEWKSGNTNISSSSSKMKSNTFVLDTNTTLSFDWAVSSESASYDYLYYTIYKDGSAMSDTGTSTKIGGNSSVTTQSGLSYTTVNKTLSAGTYYIEFTYTKDGSVDNGMDAGFVRNISLGGKKAVSVLIYEFKLTNTGSYNWSYNSTYNYWESGNQGVDNSTSILTSNTIIVPKDETCGCEIQYTISSEENYDIFEYNIYKDGELYTTSKLSGLKTTTTPTDRYLGYNSSRKFYEGTYYIEFIYKKDSSNSSGLDKAFIRANLT